jgi:transcriptional regulator with XRE-family HTH domain
VTDHDPLRPILERFAETARSVADGSAPASALSEVAEKVALEAEAAAFRNTNDGWGTLATVGDTVRQRVSDMRRTKGWTQEQLALEMRALGFDWKRLTVTEIERGTRRVSVEELIGLAVLWEMPVVALVQPADGVGLELNDVELPDRDITVLFSGSGGVRQVARSARLVRGLLRSTRPTTAKEEPK